MERSARARINQMSLSAVVTRADGTQENLGTIAYWHKNPLRRWMWAVLQLLQGRKPGRIS